MESGVSHNPSALYLELTVFFLSYQDNSTMRSPRSTARWILSLFHQCTLQQSSHSGDHYQCSHYLIEYFAYHGGNCMFLFSTFCTPYHSEASAVK